MSNEPPPKPKHAHITSAFTSETASYYQRTSNPATGHTKIQQDDQPSTHHTKTVITGEACPDESISTESQTLDAEDPIRKVEQWKGSAYDASQL
jgi:hypothetical protein